MIPLVNQYTKQEIHATGRTSTLQPEIRLYAMMAASALAFMTISQYSAGGGLTVPGIPFYENGGVHWILAILGCLSIMMVPDPYVFSRCGPRTRKHSKYAVAKPICN